MRISIVGNAGGGKSTLSRRLANSHNLPLFEIDSILWQKGWKPTPEEDYNAIHQDIISSGSWIIDGLGRLDSLEARLMASTDIIVVEFPLWQHYWLAAERHVTWIQGEDVQTPGGHGDMPPLKALFKTIAEVDKTWLPKIKKLVLVAESAGVTIHRINDYQQLDSFKL